MFFLNYFILFNSCLNGYPSILFTFLVFNYHWPYFFFLFTISMVFWSFLHNFFIIIIVPTSKKFSFNKWLYPWLPLLAFSSSNIECIFTGLALDLITLQQINKILHTYNHKIYLSKSTIWSKHISQIIYIWLLPPPSLSFLELVVYLHVLCGPHTSPTTLPIITHH